MASGYTARQVGLLRESAFTVRAGRIASIMREAFRKPTTAIGGVIIVVLLGVAVFAPLIMEPNQPDAYQLPRDWRLTNAPPGTDGHVLGTTAEGGDVLYGIVWGARSSVRLSVTVVAVAVVDRKSTV